MATAPWIHRARLYALHSNSVGYASWAEFDRPYSGHVNPDLPPPQLADEGYYFANIGRVSARMGVDGLVFTTPSIRAPQNVAVLNPDGTASVERNPDAWRFRAEGLTEATAAGSRVSDKTAIRDGMIAMRRVFYGKIILYAGYPPADIVLSRDTEYADHRVQEWLGPYVSGGADALIWDSAGDYFGRPECRAMVQAAARQWPSLRQGGEPNCINLAGNRWQCSLSTRDAAMGSTIWAPWRMQLSDSYQPVIVAFTNARRPDREEVIEHLRAGRCCAIQPWTVGYDVETPTDEDRVWWEALVSEAKVIQQSLPGASS